MAGVNKVILVGNLGKDPEVRHLENNVAVATFSLATSESYNDKNGQRVDKTEWHNIVMWRGLADVAEKYLRKGHTIYVEGKIRTRDYQDKEGVKRYTTEIVAEQMTMLSKPAERPPLTEPSTAPASTAGNGSGYLNDELDNDLPF